MHELLKNTIKSVAAIPDEEIDKLLDYFKPKRIPGGEYFIRAGEVPTKFGFVVRGLFRYVYIDKHGKEFTKGFLPEQRFISSYSSMIRNIPSYFFIEALEDSEIMEIDHQRWLESRDAFPLWDSFLLKLIEKGFITKEKRERELLLLEAEERYRIFLEEHPALENRVKQHMIASYLGITPESLSRIKKNWSP
jgi:CRP-like cAMP-binding protein